MTLIRLCVLTALLGVSTACHIGDEDTPNAPSGPSSIRVEAFTATVTPGAGATLSEVTLTAQTSLGNIGRTLTAAQSFGTTRIDANGTAIASVTFDGPPVAASQLSVRVPFTDDRGNAGTAEGTTTVTTGS